MVQVHDHPGYAEERTHVQEDRPQAQGDSLLHQPQKRHILLHSHTPSSIQLMAEFPVNRCTMFLAHHGAMNALLAIIIWTGSALDCMRKVLK